MNPTTDMLRRIILHACLILIQGVGTASAAESLPKWAFFIPDPHPPASKEHVGPRTLAGSSRTYTQAQINDLKNSPDWFPTSHPPMPPIVAGGGQKFACASCHLVSGMGHPPNAALAGQPVAYLERQLAEFKSGKRVNPIKVGDKPQQNSLQFMIGIAQSLTPQEANAAARYFAGIKPIPWVDVVETETVPRTYVNVDFERSVYPGNTREALGSRIIELPKDADRQAERDPRSGTIAYVPVGSVHRGGKLVSGAKVPCLTCHGADLKGGGDIPSIAGRSPTSIFRQLYLFKVGARHGAMAELMKQQVGSLTQADMIDVAAYLGTRRP